MIENGMMRALSDLLSPLPDKSLPAFEIRTELLKLLQDFSRLDQAVLKQSGLGKAMTMLFKHPKEVKENKEVASRLIRAWSRPIFQDDLLTNLEHRPALRKRKMLHEVKTMLLRADMTEAMIESGMMSAVSDWLSPLPDKSLHALEIRTELLKLLQDFSRLDQAVLKQSVLGKAMMMLFKHPKEVKENKELASRLIRAWSRPIFQKPRSGFPTLTPIRTPWMARGQESESLRPIFERVPVYRETIVRLLQKRWIPLPVVSVSPLRVISLRLYFVLILQNFTTRWCLDQMVGIGRVVAVLSADLVLVWSIPGTDKQG